jgi:hypothetical protein
MDPETEIETETETETETLWGKKHTPESPQRHNAMPAHPRHLPGLPRGLSAAHGSSTST